MKKVVPYILVNVLFLFYSLAEVFSKLAAGQEFLSFNFILLYGCTILILGVYALIWQKLLNYLPLNIAFSNKAVIIIWGLVFSCLIFKDTLSIQKIIGAAVIIAGVLLTILGGEKKNNE